MIKIIYGNEIESKIIIAGVKYYVTPEQLNDDKICIGDKVLFKKEITNKYDKSAIEITHINLNNNCCTKLGYIPQNITILLAPIYNKIKMEGEISTIYNLGEIKIIIIKLKIKFLEQKGIFAFINIKKWTIAWGSLDIEIKNENIQASLLIDEINIIINCLKNKTEANINGNAISKLKKISNKSRLKKEADKLIVHLSEQKKIYKKAKEACEEITRIINDISVLEDKLRELKEKMQKKINGDNFIINPQFQDDELNVLQMKQIERELYYELLIIGLDYLAIDFTTNMKYKLADDPIDRMCDQQACQDDYEIMSDIILKEIKRIEITTTNNNSEFITVIPNIAFVLSQKKEINTKTILDAIMFSINYILKDIGTMKNNFQKILQADKIL